MKELEVIKFINNNPNWRELLTQKPYCLSISEDNNYMLLKYNQIDSDFNQEICKECRGLIINKITIEPVALSFYKFFNIEEPFAATIDWNTAQVQEKIDGSKILVWFSDADNKWRISTSGCLNAYDAYIENILVNKPTSFGELFEMALKNHNISINKFFATLNKHKCYTFELVSPINRVVIPYDRADVYLIGKRDIRTFIEEEPRIDFNIRKPQLYNLNSVEECRKALDEMDWDQEGFVVVDSKWNRVKIKNKKYLIAAYLKNNGVQSKRRILDIIKNNEQAEFLAYFPEYTQRFEEIEQTLSIWLDNAFNALITTISKGPYDTRKDLALYVMANYKEYSDLIFHCWGKGSDTMGIGKTNIIAYIRNWLFDRNPDYIMKKLGLREEKINKLEESNED